VYVKQFAVFLETFAKWLKATISFVISVCYSACLSVRPSVGTDGQTYSSTS